MCVNAVVIELLKLFIKLMEPFHIIRMFKENVDCKIVNWCKKCSKVFKSGGVLYIQLKRHQVSLAPEALLVQIFCKKCLHPMLLKMTCLWRPSAWLSARLWLARVKLSLSPSLLAPPSPSPWTPRRQHLCQRRRRSPVLQLWDEMLREERISWKGRWNLLLLRRLQIQSNAHLSSPTHLCHFLQWWLCWSPSSKTNVMTDLYLIRAWYATQKQHTK